MRARAPRRRYRLDGLVQAVIGLSLATSRELFRFPRTTRDLGGPKTHVNPAAAPRSVEHAALGAPVRRTPARPRPP